MTDIATIGTLAASVMATATDAVIKGFATEAVKDSYKALKNRILGVAGTDTNALEANPQSKARQAVVAEIIDQQANDEKERLLYLMTALVQAIESAGDEKPVGIDVNEIRALNLQIAEINVSNGAGIKAGSIITDGDFNIGKLNVGNQ